MHTYITVHVKLGELHAMAVTTTLFQSELADLETATVEDDMFRAELAQKLGVPFDPTVPSEAFFVFLNTDAGPVFDGESVTRQVKLT